MITLQLLEENDTIESNDWCRPLAINSMSGGYSDHYSFKNQYSGTPENNSKWVQVKHIFGSCWFGKTVKELNGNGYSKHWPVETRMEFVRGEIPKKHQLDMKGFSSVASFEKKLKKQEEYEDDIAF